MAILYKANETQFNHLGLGPLNDAVSILVTEERNGIFELEMKYPVSGKVYHELKNDRIIKADAGHKLKDQRFKIIRISKPLKGIVTVYAEHVSYLTQDLALKPKVTFSGNARQALEHWKANLVDDNPLMVWSDISTTGKISWTIDEVENARRALGGVQGSILDVFGGEYQFDNYDIYLYQKRGVNSELLIAYGRNLVDLEQEEEIANTYTSIYPYSIYTDDDGNERMVTLPEYYIDSEHVDKYARRKILVVDFTTEEIKTVSALRSAARRYIKDNDVGVPKVNLKIQYVDLAKTLDYKHQALLEEVNLCDNVMIYFEKYDINTTAKVIKVVWDVLNERYDSIEVGEARASLSQAIDTVVDGKVHSVEKLAMQTLRTADGKNTIYFGLEEPLATQYPLKKNDIWYRIVDGEFTRTYIYDGVVWQLVIDMDSQEAKQEAQQAKDRADDAVNRANQATEDANTAIGQAQASFDLAQDAIDELANLEIGGRNLLPTLFDLFDLDGLYGYIKISGQQTIVKIYDKDVSVDISGVYFGMTGTGIDASDGYKWIVNKGVIDNDYYLGVNNNYPYFSFYPKTKETFDKIFRRFYIKIEKGTVATDWSPAPEDVDQKIDVVANDLDGLSVTVSNNVGNITSLQATAQGLQTSVSNLQGDVTTVTQIATGLQTRMSDAEGNINTLQVTTTSLAGRLTDAEGNLTTLTATVDGLQTTVSDVQGNVANLTVVSNAMQARLSDAEGNINTLTLTSQSMQSTISSLQDDWDNLEIGGRNLLKEQTDDWIELFRPSGNYFYQEGSDYEVEPGQTYTFSIIVDKISDDNVQINLHLGLGRTKGGYNWDFPQWRLNNIPFGEKISLTYTVKETDGSSNGSIYFAWRLRNERLETTIRYKEVKLEKGNKATDWSPAPEDMATQSQITQLSDAINLRVTKKDLINQINIDTSGILISGKKLILDGDTTVLGTFKVDGSAHIKDSSIGTAQIGTIDAAIANIINLSANSIVGGILSSQNDNMTLNMNTGRLHMQRVDFTLGSGADIEFLDRGNRVYFKDTVGGITRSAGMGVGIGTSGYPFAYLGATGTSELNTLSEFYSGIIVATTKAMSEGGTSSFNGYRWQFRNKSIGWDKGMTIDWAGNTPSLLTLYPSNYDYELGTFRRFYGKQSLSFTNYYNERSGWLMETTYAGDGTDITFRGAYGSDYNYQIGGSSTNNRIRNIYLRNNPNVSSDERLKTDINDLGLGLDFINRIEAKQFRLISTNADINQGITQNPIQYGIIAQQVNSVLADFGVSDSSLITQSDDGYYGAQYEQFIPTLIKSVQELDTKFTDDVNYLKLKVQYLEQKIKQLEGAA